MLTYNLDIHPQSIWLHTTSGAAALAQPYRCTEVGLFYGNVQFSTACTVERFAQITFKRCWCCLPV